MNAPQGDFTERLVTKAFEGELAPNSEKSWDVRTGSGVLLQVKSRVIHDGDPASARATSPFRSWDLDAAVIVLLADNNVSVVQATELPVDAVREVSRWVGHVNGWVLTPSNAVMASGRDITELLRTAATSLQNLAESTAIRPSGVKDARQLLASVATEFPVGHLCIATVGCKHLRPCRIYILGCSPPSRTPSPVSR